MKSKIFNLLMGICFCISANAQGPLYASLNSGGGVALLSNGQITYAIGTLTAQSFSNDQFSLSPGFLHYQGTIVSLPEFKDVDNTSFLYPNPTDAWLKIQGVNKGVLSYQIQDLNGKLLKRSTINGQQEIPVKSLNRGMYIIKFQTASGQSVGSWKFIKK